MPSWWGKSSSKDLKKKSAKENLIGTLQRFISSAEQHSVVRSKAGRKRSTDTVSEIGFRSRAESRSTSPSAQVARCQSFSADRPLSHPLPLPGPRSGVTCTASEVSTSKPILEKRGKPPLFLPLPTSKRIVKRLETRELDGELAITSVSSNCSPDSDETADSQLNSPVGNDFDKSNISVTNIHLRGLHKDQSPIAKKNLRDMSKLPHQGMGNQILTTSPKMCIRNNYHSTVQISQYGALRSAPDSSVSSPSRSPMRVCPEQIPTSAFWAAKPQADVTFLGSGQCSSPGSGQTSGHNSMGGDILGQFWQQSRRGSPEYSPIPSPRMTSPGPSSRIHSGTVSPCAGGTAPGSPTSRLDEGKKQRHRLPEPSRNIPGSSLFGPNNAATNNSTSLLCSPGKSDNPSTPRWKKGKLIGHGTFGHVYVGFNSESGEMCAMKEVTLFMDDAKSKESAKHLGQEISLLSRLRHPNIVQYIGCEMVDEKLYIYLEYVSGGSIHKLLQEYGQFGEPAIRSYTQQILSGLAYLHSKNTVHRDIKGANILVDPNGRVKLADFGMAKHITGQSCPLSFKGSPYWMAPEVIKNSNGCGLAVDIWSLGCTVLEMATSKPPWSQYEGIAAMFKIGNSKELPAIPDHLSDEGKDFIRRCLQREPSNRPTAAELLQHSFVNSAAPLEKFIVGCGPCELPISIPPKNGEHVRNLSTLDKEGLGVHFSRGGRSTLTDGVRTRYVSCPVSPIGSPMLNSRSTHVSGRISPSPIASPRTTSGASTPLTGGNGAIPFNQPKQITYLHDACSNSSRTANDLYPCGTVYNGPMLDLLVGMQKSSPNLRERMTYEADMLGLQFGRVRNANLREPCERQLPLSDCAAHQKLRDQIKANPSLDLVSSSSTVNRTNGI